MKRKKERKNRKLKKKYRSFLENYLKANRRGSREAELEQTHDFAARHKVHHSKKSYSRKNYDVREEFK